jgi:hypothetical protein
METLKNPTTQGHAPHTDAGPGRIEAAVLFPRLIDAIDPKAPREGAPERSRQ